MALCECGCGEPAPIAAGTDRRRGAVKGEPLRYVLGHISRTPASRAASAERMRANHADPAYQARLNNPQAQEARATAARARVAELHPSWKGDEASYQAKHTWLAQHKPKTGTCERCGQTPPSGKGCRASTEWANVSGEYLREPSDYVELCPPCHRRFDVEHGRGRQYERRELSV